MAAVAAVAAVKNLIQTAMEFLMMRMNFLMTPPMAAVTTVAAVNMKLFVPAKTGHGLLGTMWTVMSGLLKETIRLATSLAKGIWLMLLGMAAT